MQVQGWISPDGCVGWPNRIGGVMQGQPGLNAATSNNEEQYDKFQNR